MTIEQRFGDPYTYARATMSPNMDDREASIYMDGCVSQWDKYKDKEVIL